MSKLKAQLVVENAQLLRVNERLRNDNLAQFAALELLARVVLEKAPHCREAELARIYQPQRRLRGVG